jgi:hypothetical protein
VLRQGATAGLLGAVAVATWFLVIDMMAGHPLRTPQVLGEAFLSMFGPVVESPAELVAGYTVFHLLAFTGIGIVAAWLVDASRREPTLSAGLVVLFVVFQVMFYGLVAVVAQGSVLATLAWYQIGAANLAAAASMGTYLWRTNPELKTTLEWALSGREA